VHAQGLGHAQARRSHRRHRSSRHDDLNAVNTRDQPGKIAPAPLEGVSVNANRITATLAPASWNVIRLRRGN